MNSGVERLESISKALRKYRPANCSKGRKYLDPSCPSSGADSPLLSHRKPRSIQLPSSRPSFFAKPRLTLKSAGNRRDLNPFPLESPTRVRTVRACSCYSPGNRCLTPSVAVRNRLTEFIAQCDRSESEERHRRRSTIRLSISFEDLQECVQVTKDNTGRGELIPGLGVAQTLRVIRRQKKEGARNVEDQVTLRQLVDDKRAVSNYILTHFRKMKMWKHTGIIVPRKLEDSLHVYWAKVGGS